MLRKDEPSYADLVYEVLRSAARPLTFAEIFDEVNRRRPVTTRNPRGTIRNALSQGRQLASLGDGTYGYLPHLVRGSVLRVPLAGKKPANQPLVYPDEVRQALWPSFFESQKRKSIEPVRVQLPGGNEVVLSLDMLSPGVWGSPLPEGLAGYLAQDRAAAGDCLLVKVLDAESGRAEAWFEPRRKRDEAAIGKRNRELADAALEIFRRRRGYGVPIWDVVIALLARGCYRAGVAPDPLEKVLAADARFADVGLSAWMPAAAVTPELQGFIQDRKKLAAELLQPTGRAPAPPAAASPRDPRYVLERMLADVGAALSTREFASAEEVNAFVQELLAQGGGKMPRRTAATPLEKAQDLLYEAQQTTDPRQRVRLARQALATSADCADAYVLLAEETARSESEAADLYAKGMAAAERALGEEVFAEDVGHFWGLVETRPYMRARLGLAQVLWLMDKAEEAITHLWDMLRLNPGDNQGVRYLLLGWLLRRGDDAQVKKLLELYADDAAAVWTYGQALHAFRHEGDTRRSRRSLAEAKKWNPHVPAYLLGRKRLPQRLPALVGFGDESEAIACAAEQIIAWRNTPGALDWLAEQTR